MTYLDPKTGASSGHMNRGPQWPGAAAGAADFPDGHGRFEAHTGRAVGEHNFQPTSPNPVPKGDASAGPHFPDGQPGGDSQEFTAVGEHNPPALAKEDTEPISGTPVLAFNPWADSNAPLLALLADSLDDLERTRIANENRLRQLTRDEADADGEERGFGLTLDQPEVAQLAAMVSALRCGEKPKKNGCCLEHDATKNLQRAVRKHPLGPWVKATIGVGEKQGARLLAAIGDPYWNSLHNRPRLVSELWAYCGLHVLPAAQGFCATQESPGGGGKQGDPGHAPPDAQGRPAGVAPTRARGQRANWSTTAKTRAYLIAGSCIKQARSPYRAVYDDGRKKYADAVHATPCRRCGPSGKPAEAGSPLSAGHQHARAMRLVMKEILKDLWLESKRIHETAQA